VTLTDDKCTGVTAISGDANGNMLMESNETWTYTCRKYIEYTTTNTATAVGRGNGLTVTSLALANVAVSSTFASVSAPAPAPAPAPVFPNTGFGSFEGRGGWAVGLAGLFVSGTLLLAVTKRKREF
jgi:hypothetical protein